MDNFKTTDNGGLPLVLNDFRFIDASIREAFKALMGQFDTTDQVAVIMHGCQRSVAAGTVSIAAGAVSIGGEICVVPAHSYPVPAGGNFEFWQIQVSYDSTGNKEFQDGDTNFTYEKRTAKVIVASSVPVGHTEYADSRNTFSFIREKINTGVWTTLYTVTVTGGSMGSVPNGTYKVEFKKDSAEFVHFRGVFPYDDPSSGAVNILIGTLPVGFRPSQKMTLVATTGMQVSGDLFKSTVEINTNGEVRVRSADGPAVLLLQTDQLTPFEGG